MTIKERMVKAVLELQDKILDLHSIIYNHFFPTTRAKVGKRVLDKCRFCPYVVIKPNVWVKVAGAMAPPTYQCRDKDMAFIYNHERIPRWCPHAIK